MGAHKQKGPKKESKLITYAWERLTYAWERLTSDLINYIIYPTIDTIFQILCIPSEILDIWLLLSKKLQHQEFLSLRNVCYRWRRISPVKVYNLVPLYSFMTRHRIWPSTGLAEHELLTIQMNMSSFSVSVGLVCFFGFCLLLCGTSIDLLFFFFFVIELTVFRLVASEYQFGIFKLFLFNIFL